MKIRILVSATLLSLCTTGALADSYDDERYQRDDRYDQRYDGENSTVNGSRYERYNDCERCGEVVAIDRRSGERSASGGGAVAGAVIGGLLGNQVGGGDGKKLATVAGLVAGGVAGNNIEKNRNGRDDYQLVVEMDNGRRVTLNQNELDGIRRGDRVYVAGGRARLI